MCSSQTGRWGYALGMLLGLGGQAEKGGALSVPGPLHPRSQHPTSQPTAPQILAPAPQILTPCTPDPSPLHPRSWPLHPRSQPPASPEPQQHCNPRLSSPAPPAAQGNAKEQPPWDPGAWAHPQRASTCGLWLAVSRGARKPQDPLPWIQACGAHLRAPPGVGPLAGKGYPPSRGTWKVPWGQRQPMVGWDAHGNCG